MNIEEFEEKKDKNRGRDESELLTTNTLTSARVMSVLTHFIKEI